MHQEERLVHCQVKFYAYYRTVTGRQLASIELPEGTNLSEALQVITQTWPDLSSRPAAVMVLLNRSKATGGELIQEGDLIELVPPVAGGA